MESKAQKLTLLLVENTTLRTQLAEQAKQLSEYKKKILCGTLLIIIFFMVFFAWKYQPPFCSIIKNKNQPLNSKEAMNEYLETDVNALISIKNKKNISEKRDELIRFIWGKPGLPLSEPSIISNNFEDTRYKDIRSISKIEKMVIEMDFGLKSYVYHFIPKNPKNKVILYHQGHDGDFINGKKEIRKLIENGYSVVAFSMPLLGDNNQPKVTINRIGKLRITTHDHMKFLTPKNGHPVKYFIEPIVSVLNYLTRKFDYLSVSMMGISGGGWTTTLASAIDIRIRYSFPVAGSYPIYLRSDSQRDWGDYEQNVPELYRTVNYLELYILGAHGEKRKQIQIINKYDPCCFSGIKWQTYLDAIKAQVGQLGAGEFDLLYDDTHQKHAISGAAIKLILKELEVN